MLLDPDRLARLLKQFGGEKKQGVAPSTRPSRTSVPTKGGSRAEGETRGEKGEILVDRPSGAARIGLNFGQTRVELCVLFLWGRSALARSTLPMYP